jgi:CRP-like cAMP-binding protein
MKTKTHARYLSTRVTSREDSLSTSTPASACSFRVSRPRFSQIQFQTNSQSPTFSVFSSTDPRRSYNLYTEKNSNLSPNPVEHATFRRESTQEIFDTMFPSWLKERKDFQDTIRKFDNIDLIDLGKVCEKPPNQRTAIEKKALIDWSKDTVFFAKVSKRTLGAVCDKFVTVYFRAGDLILQEGTPGSELYIIVKGRVEVIKDGSDKPVAILSAKNVVGEHSMFTQTPRIATIIARTDVVALSLSREDYEAFISKMRQKEKYINLEFLRSIPIFREWQITKLNLLATNIFTVQYPKDRMIYNFEESPVNFYIVKEGCVYLEIIIRRQDGNRWPVGAKEWEVSTTTKEYVKNIKVCNKGDYFGEKEMLMARKRDTRAVSKSDKTVLLVLNADMFDIIFTHKEKKSLLNENKHRPSTADFQQELTDKLTNGKQKIHALLEAARINQIRGGRLAYQTESIRRKAKWLNSIIDQTKQKLRQDLIGSSTKRSRESSPCE